MGSGNAPLRAMIANTVSVRRRAGKKADIHAFRSIGQHGLKPDMRQCNEIFDFEEVSMSASGRPA